MIITTLNKISSGYTIYIGQDGEEPQAGIMAKMETDHPELVAQAVSFMVNLMLYNGDHFNGMNFTMERNPYE